MFPFWILLGLRMMEVVVATAATKCESSSQIFTNNTPTPRIQNNNKHAKSSWFNITADMPTGKLTSQIIPTMKKSKDTTLDTF